MFGGGSAAPSLPSLMLSRPSLPQPAPLFLPPSLSPSLRNPLPLHFPTLPFPSSHFILHFSFSLSLTFPLSPSLFQFHLFFFLFLPSLPFLKSYSSRVFISFSRLPSLLIPVSSSLSYSFLSTLSIPSLPLFLSPLSHAYFFPLPSPPIPLFIPLSFLSLSLPNPLSLSPLICFSNCFSLLFCFFLYIHWFYRFFLQFICYGAL